MTEQSKISFLIDSIESETKEFIGETLSRKILKEITYKISKHIIDNGLPVFKNSIGQVFF